MHAAGFVPCRGRAVFRTVVVARNRGGVSVSRAQSPPRWVTALVVAFWVLGSALPGCGDGDSPPTTPAPAPSPPPAPEPPAVPSRLAVSARGPTYLVWAWDPVEGATGYEAQFSADPVFDDADRTSTVTDPTFRVEDLTTGSSGSLRVRAQAGAANARLRSAWSEPVAGATTAGGGLGAIEGADEEGTLACQAFEDLETGLGYVAAEDILRYLEFFARKVLSGECGRFDTGDAIEWEGEERRLRLEGLPAELPTAFIRVWGAPHIDADLERRADRSRWWVARTDTSFDSGPAPG